MKTKNCETYFNIVDQLKDYFFQHVDEFARMAEVADSFNGCLGDDRLYPMAELDELYSGQSPTYILERAFFGYSWNPYAPFEHRYSDPFNPNLEYFFLDGYSNLVSVPGFLYENYYRNHIDRDHVEAIFEAWENGIFFSDDDDELDRLYLALAEFED